MRDQLLIQYGAIRETINTNVQTIGKLFEQAKSLRSIVDKLGDGDDAIKEEIEAQIAAIQETTFMLLKQTDGLFQKYSEFVENVFKK